MEMYARGVVGGQCGDGKQEVASSSSRSYSTLLGAACRGDAGRAGSVATSVRQAAGRQCGYVAELGTIEEAAVGAGGGVAARVGSRSGGGDEGAAVEASRAAQLRNITGCTT